MPARFQGRSEYESQFKTWNGCLKKGTLAEPFAGLASVDLGDIKEPSFQHKKRTSPSIPEMHPNESSSNGNVMEPPLQRKKKPLAATTTTTTQWVQQQQQQQQQNGKEYILLGSHDKFSHNVQYVPKGGFSHPKPTPAGKENGALNGDVTPTTPPPAPRVVPPAPKVYVDTGAPKKSKSSFPPAKKSKAVGTETTNTKPEETKKMKDERNSKEVYKKLDNDGKAREERLARKAYEAQLAHEREVLRVQKESKKIKEGMPQPQVASGQPSKTVSVKVKKDAKERIEEKRPGTVNEFVQTNLDAGVVDSGQEADNGYAMRYRAGVAPPRSKGPKRLSEYQLQYKWQKGVPSSPLLAADQIVYQSNTQIGPYKTETAPKKSEYASQFKGYRYQPVPKEPSEGPKKRAKIKRSRSLEAVSPDRLPPAGLNRVTSEFDPRLVQESLNPNRMNFPHGKFKKEISEYHRNFKAPSDYVYEEGAWKGASAPHENPPVVEPEAVPETADTPGSNWYSEVVELRKKAAEYRTRARGTHFSRSHLAQLYAQNAELWDTYSVVSALSLESGSAARQNGGAEGRPAVTEAWKEEAPSAKTDSALDSVRTQDGFSDSSTLVNAESEEGRLPTPQVRKRASPYVRHHLDRTTPSVGGALLTSPPRVKVREYKAIKGQDSSAMASPDLATPSSDTQPPPKRPSTAPAANSQTASMPTFGMPTRDTHVLLDEEASTDRPLNTKYIHSPQQPRLARQKFPEADVPPTIDENGSPTFVKSRPSFEVRLDDIPPRPRDEDALSTSLRSVASSCSMASEILERARKRRDEFWGPNGKLKR